MVNNMNVLATKTRGKIYTPDYLVKQILEIGHYAIGNINQKHVIDNSCGDGQFLVQIVDLYCTDFKRKSKNYKKLKKELETYIHGIELIKEELNICIKRCDMVAKHHGIEDKIKWDFICSNTLVVDKYNGKMDFVIGNPPYVRVHNLNDNFSLVKKFNFATEGMTDLFIVFYEVGITMLSPSGILCYISPSSFFTSVAGNKMRNYFQKNNLLETICDLKHFQPFNATAYTAIVCLNKLKTNNNVEYYEYDYQKIKPKYVCSIKSNGYLIDNKFYFNEKMKLDLLKQIINSKNKSRIQVKNGFATLADSIFINKFNFKSKYIIPVLKASRGVWSSIFYPYDNNSQLIEYTEIKKDEQMYKYIEAKKDQLLKSYNHESWYGFGRTQAINDTFTQKIAINTLIKQPNNLKVFDVPPGSGIYSGLYILPNGVKDNKIKSALKSDEFAMYISLLGKYKSGGFYTFSTKDVKKYLDYKLGE